MNAHEQDYYGPMALIFGAIAICLLISTILMANLWIKPRTAISEGAFEYDGAVYLVEKAPSGTIMRDGKIYRTEEFTQTQPAKEE